MLDLENQLWNRSLTLASLSAVLCCASAHAVGFDWSTIGNPGNPSDVLPSLEIGSVPYEYRISKHEVTNAQYTDFLNSVDPSGLNSRFLYSSLMASNPNGGILNSNADPEGQRYQVKPGRAQNPVVFVSFVDAMRFANWLHNGQGSGDTEDGVYQIDLGGVAQRLGGARFFLPNRDEWHKAAHYDPVLEDYYVYATGTNERPYSDNPASLNTPDNSNVANYAFSDGVDNGYNDGFAVTGESRINLQVNNLTDVGSYSLATSPYDTFDQTGNVGEWLETPVRANFRHVTGGSWFSGSIVAGNSIEIGIDQETFTVGFRVASAVPEPSIQYVVVFCVWLAGCVRQRSAAASMALGTLRACPQW